MLLELDGYIVHAVAGVVEALATLRVPPLPSVILLDMLMPKLDGNDFLKALRADPLLAAIPVVVMSAAYQPAAATSLPFLLKPVDPDNLIRVIRAHCDPG